MTQAKWIWYFGDYEIYHSLLLHSRRTEKDHDYPAFWPLSTPYPNVVFRKHYTSVEPDTVRFICRGCAYVEIDGVRHAANTDIAVPAGEHAVLVRVLEPHRFPALYASSKTLVTDESWTAELSEGRATPVGCEPAYTEPTDDVYLFPFVYERVDAVKKQKTSCGTLYDFGREMMGRIVLSEGEAGSAVRLVYGESKEEALSPEDAIIREVIPFAEGDRRPSRAFRYVCVKAEGREPKIYAEAELVARPVCASFRCDKPLLNRIWQVCADTLTLCSREFFLDGIKRDRWVWSGDAYQSAMADRYLAFDASTTRRTILSLLGKPPYEVHINTINDYSALLLITADEYYGATGDKEFIRKIFDRLSSLYEFICSRLDENGYVCQRTGDWIFIDWSDMDKGGPMAAEQILLWRAQLAMARLSEAIGLSGEGYRAAAARLKRSIMRDFWREERAAFIDCHTTGLENVTRHANIFAILYDFVGNARAKKILRSVLKNDAVNKITTPYFAFFELCALAKMGRLRDAERYIVSYWGGMLKKGATSIWEQYLPTEKGCEHFAMYGEPFGRSLCHAWGGGPLYLLGRYGLGVHPTAVGYETFAVEPNLGILREMEGTVPLPNGESVTVSVTREHVTVTATREGGVLRLGKREYVIPKGTPLSVSLV